MPVASRAHNAEGLLGIFNVWDFGAMGDGQHDDAGGIQAAILAAGASGGGLVAIPAGTYRLGSNVVWGTATNVTLWQHSGATFTGPGTLPVAAGSNAIRVEPGGATVGGVPTTSLVGDPALAGVATTAAATDHLHGREVFGGAPVAQAFGDAAAAGAAATPARSDHRHGMPGNGSVGTAQLAANAATQSASASGVTANPTTTSATYVDLPDMVITLTTSPRPGGTSELLVWLIASLTSSVVPVISNVALSLDGAAEAGAFSVTPSVATTDHRQGVAAFRFTGLAAGAHTVKGRWATNTGTTTAFGVERQLLVEELKP